MITFRKKSNNIIHVRKKEVLEMEKLVVVYKTVIFPLFVLNNIVKITEHCQIKNIYVCLWSQVVTVTTFFNIRLSTLTLTPPETNLDCATSDTIIYCIKYSYSVLSKINVNNLRQREHFFLGNYLFILFHTFVFLPYIT